MLAYLDGVFEIGVRHADPGRPAHQAGDPADDRRHGRRARTITKVPLLWGAAPLYPKEGGFWDFFHEGRLEIAMLCGSVFLLIVGAGSYSLDARMSRAPSPHQRRVCHGLGRTHSNLQGRFRDGTR